MGAHRRAGLAAASSGKRLTPMLILILPVLGLLLTYTMICRLGGRFIAVRRARADAARAAHAARP